MSACIRRDQSTITVITRRRWTARWRAASTTWPRRAVRPRAVPLRVRGPAHARGALGSRTRVGPHTISVPRVRPADDIDPDTFDNGVPDDVFAKIVACIRIAVPYTGLIISTREPQAMREQLLELGVSQISGGSRTSVGGYVSEEDEDESTAQFNVYDNRSLDEVVSWLMELGYIPSFCTACYRAGRQAIASWSSARTNRSQLLPPECSYDARRIPARLRLA